MVEKSQDATLRAALSSIGAEAWLEPSTVLASANLRATQQMIRELAGLSQGGVCILAPTDNGCRRFHIEPNADDAAAEVLIAMTIAGYSGAEVVVNAVAPGRYGRPSEADITTLRGITVQFRQRPDETDGELIERAFGDRFGVLVRREGLNPLIIRDTIADRYSATLDIEAPIPLRDAAERARATAVIHRITAHLGGDAIADPLPGIVGLAGSEMVNAAGVVAGKVIAYRLPARARVHKLPSSLDALEKFAARLESGAAPIQH